MAKIHERLRRYRRPTPHPTGEVEQAPEISEPVFKGRLSAHFFVRIHMLLIFSLMILSGVSASKLMLEFGVRSMPVRYAIAVGAAYGVFFLLVRLWLWYVGIARSKARDRMGGSKLLPGGDEVGRGLSCLQVRLVNLCSTFGANLFEPMIESLFEAVVEIKK